MMNVCAGPDERDPNSLPAERVDYVKGLRGSLGGLRLAWSDDLGFADCVDPEVAAVCARAARAFRELGCRVEEVTPRWPSPFEAWSEIFCGGIATRLAPYLDRRAEIDVGLAKIIDGTLRNSPTKYVQAWLDRLAWWQHPRAFFEKYDLLLTPTIACPPFRVGLDNPTEIAAALRTARKRVERRLIAVYQPHVYERTRQLARELGEALGLADVAIVTDVIGGRDDARPGVTGKLVLDNVPRGARRGWAPTLEDAALLARSWARPGDVVVTLGVGEPWRIARSVVDGLPG